MSKDTLNQQSWGITRFEVIGPEGRQVVHNAEVTMQLQDDGRTLKVFTKHPVKLLDWDKESSEIRLPNEKELLHKMVVDQKIAERRIGELDDLDHYANCERDMKVALNTLRPYLTERESLCPTCNKPYSDVMSLCSNSFHLPPGYQDGVLKREYGQDEEIKILSALERTFGHTKESQLKAIMKALNSIEGGS